MTDYVFTVLPSPIGSLTLIGSDRGLAAILWQSQRSNREAMRGAAEDPHHAVLRVASRQLDEYFAFKRKTFDVPLDFEGTLFQKRVWNALLTIPFGETRSYGEIAEQLGDRNLMRAVGAANGQNPIPIIAPCHRVIGASGGLVGFGGGLEVKAALLDLESGSARLDFGAGFSDTSAREQRSEAFL
jgi:methylated-DNA-[protein]-cysteine S-methyltransferase